MKIFVKSRAEMRTLAPGPNAVCISIGSPEDGETQVSPTFQDILRLYFYDTIVPELSIQESHVEQILDFVEKNKDADELYVHCFAGISRSAGVAIAVAEILGDLDQADSIRAEKYFHNRYVLNLIWTLYKARQDARA